MAKPAPKPDPTRHWTYWWAQYPDRLECNPWGDSQTVTTKLWEAEAPTEVHDRVLMDVTAEVNRVLAEVAEKCPHAAWELGFIAFQGRYMLAWTEPMMGGLGPHDDPREVMKALRLRF